MRKTPAAIALSRCASSSSPAVGLRPGGRNHSPPHRTTRQSCELQHRPAPPTAGTASAQPSKTTGSVRNDLAKGSAKRSLEAGGVRMSINYWSALSMGDWTAAALKPLNMSASAVFIDGSKQDIFLAKVTVNIGVEGPDGPLKAPAALVDDASLTPGYLITSPSVRAGLHDPGRRRRRDVRVARPHLRTPSPDRPQGARLREADRKRHLDHPDRPVTPAPRRKLSAYDATDGKRSVVRRQFSWSPGMLMSPRVARRACDQRCGD